MKKHGKLTTQKSVTVPNEAMTIKDILIKHTRGLDLRAGLQRNGAFQGDNDLDHDAPDLEKLYNCDNAERAENLQQLHEEVMEKQKLAQAEADAKKKEDDDKMASEALEYKRWKEQAKQRDDSQDDRDDRPKRHPSKRRDPSGPEQ